MKPTPFRQPSRSLVARIVAWTLAHALALGSLPAMAAPPAPAGGASTAQATQAQVSRPTAPPAVKVNRTVPKVRPVPLRPAFSAEPADSEFFRARIFEEPLVPIGGSTSSDENRALARAIQAYVDGGDHLDLSPLEGFLRERDGSAWRASLQLGMGLAYVRAGRFTRAAAAWRDAWTLAKAGEDPHSSAVANRALAELADLQMSFTQVTETELLLKEVEGRSMSGSAIETLNNAHVRLAARTEHPHLIRATAASAVARVLANRRNGDYRPDPRLESFTAPQYGTTLTQAEALAKEVGLDLRMAYHAEKDAPVPVPSVVHLSMGHYAAVVARNEAATRYLVEDPAFGALWMTREALDEEASGYYLVPGEDLPEGWRPVDTADGDRILGRCLGPANSDNTTDRDDCEGPDCRKECKGMATYSFLALTINLRVSDTPVGYSPPRGPSVNFQVTYNHKEAGQPATFTWSNLGQRWTFDQLSFIEDGNLARVVLHPRGGGMEAYVAFNGQSTELHYKSQRQLVRVSTDPIVWEVRRNDGSVDTYAQPDCDVCSGRRVFMTESKDAAGNSLAFTYDQDFRLVAITDAIGQVTTLSYELAGDPYKITRVTDPFGRFAQFDYSPTGYLVRITDVIGLTSEFQYAANEGARADFITALTTPYGTTTFSQGEAVGGKWSWLEATDHFGGKERIAYDKDDVDSQRPAPIPPEQKHPPQDPPAIVPTGFAEYNNALNEGLTHYWSKRAMALHPGDYRYAKAIRWFTDIYSYAGGWHTSGVKQSEKMPLENRVWYAYEGGAQFADYGRYFRGPSALPTKIGRVLDDGTSQVYRYEYNSKGNRIRETDPLGRTTIYSYAANEIDLLRAERVNGQDLELLASYTYNDKHQPLTITDARGAPTTYTYNTAGQALTVTTAPAQGHSQGPTTTFTYDTDGRLTQMSGPVSGANTTFTYDDYGRRRTTTDATGLTLTYDYDALDRVTRVTYPDTTYEETVYKWLDAEKRRDRLGRWTQTFYDALRRPLATRDAAAQTTQYQYGGSGCTSCAGGGDRLTKLIDPNGNATTWDYDLQGRVTQETRADSSSESYTYETTTSRLKQKTDRKSGTTTFEYFLDGKLKRKSYSDTTPAMSYTYDPVDGQMLTAANGTDTLTWTYDTMDRVATEASTKNASTVGYTYDDAGNRTVLSLDGATHVSYGYDQQSRLTSITRGASIFGFGYDTPSRRTSMTYPNGVVTTYGYDGESRLTSLGASLGSTPVTSFGYVLDAAGNRTRKTTLDWAEDYRYDDLYRLVSADRSAGTPSRWRFAYDPAGNRTGDQTDDAAMGGSHNNLNQLLAREPGGALAFKGSTNEPASVNVAGKPAQTASDNSFAAQTPVGAGQTDVAVTATDASGNARTNTYRVSTSGAGASYTYDPNGNLASKTEGTDNWVYSWNAENQLTKVEKNSVEQARFAYDPVGRRVEKVAAGVMISYAYDGGAILREVRGATTLKYVHGRGVDEPLAADDGTALTYFHRDALGSVVKVTGAGGAVTFARQYDAWGNLELGVGEPGYAFTGREWDPETQLYYYRARYYDPRMGRFVSEDPIRLRAGPNFYSYVRNQPASFTDPFGLRISMQLTEKAAAYDLANTCTGSVGATCYWSGPYKLSPCKKKGSCYGFDAAVPITIGEQFTVSQHDANILMSSDSPGLTIQQHEDLHMQDFREGYTDSAINAAIKTEGFNTMGECEAARSGCPAQIDAFIRGVATASHTARDKP